MICILQKTQLLSISILLLLSGLSTTVFAGHLPQNNMFPPQSYGEHASSSVLPPCIVRLYSPHPETLTLPKNVEVVSGHPGKYIDVILPKEQMPSLSKIGVPFIIQTGNLSTTFLPPTVEEYHSLAEMEQLLHTIATQHPDITRLYSIGKTYEKRDIWCLEITDNPGVDEDEPGVFFMGLHHAREWPTLEICLYLIENLTSSYGVSPTITDIVNNRRIWVVPCVNPDGYYYDHDLYDGNKWWRKNRHYFPDYGTYGVDLNRNYGGSCNGDPWGSWGSIGYGAITPHPSSEVYCGPTAFSEMETQAIRDVIIQNDIHAMITWHTFGELVMWPWGYTLDAVTPDDIYMSQIGSEIAARITCQDTAGTYTPTQSAGLYPTTGDTTDWAYGYGHYILGRPIFAYTIEACSSFHPPSETLDQVCKENFDGAFYLLQEAENISKLSTRVLPPVLEEIPVDDDGSYTVSWIEKNSDAHAMYFQLDELTDLSFVIDDAESGSFLWDLNGFFITDKRCHSSSHCFKSRGRQNDVSSMTSRYPVPVTKGMNLSFWCWYDIETDYDMAFVEVSEDGRFYDILDTFTGTSNGWMFKTYALDDYAGESVFIRFRFTSDDNTLWDGFFVDDISPMADFETVTTLSNTIFTTEYLITGKPEGNYYYRVRGYNNDYGWGDFSTLQKVQVAFEENNPPMTPTLFGPSTGRINTEYTYTVIAVDPDEDAVYYYMDWGDGSSSGWVGPFGSGEEITFTHSWSEKGNYDIRVKAKDSHGAESDWATLEVSMPRYMRLSVFRNLLLEWLKERWSQI